MKGSWIPHDTRDEVVDFVRAWSDKTEVAADRFIRWIGVARGKFFDWRKRYGKANEQRAGASRPLGRAGGAREDRLLPRPTTTNIRSRAIGG